MERRSRYIGAVLWGSVCFLFIGVDLGSWTGVIATELSNYSGSTSSLNPVSSSCNFTTLFSTRSTWSGVGEPCSQKLPFELWIYMKAEGTADDADANHVRSECLLSRAIGVVELVTPEDWNTTIMDSAPGQLMRETKRAACYRVRSPLDFEAMCTDDQVTKVSRINAVTDKPRGHFSRKTTRRLQDTVSEAGNAHGVDLLISGLDELRCQRTTGEDQTLCLMSDSFNRLGGKVALQESGDLPPDEFLTIVEELPLDSDEEPSDEGSAMTELAYDIASGANFKFNTFFDGSVAAADDIIKLVSDEACDVLVDDISFGDQPGFRDGVVAQAVDEVVNAGSLYFSSAGNDRNGLKFTSKWECTSDIFGDVINEPCDSGVASHVFNPDSTGMDRYALELDPARLSPLGNAFILHWDDDDGTSRNVIFTLWTVNDFTGSVTPFTGITGFGTAVAFIDLPPIVAGDVAFITISQVFTDLEDVEMRLLSRTDEIFSDFSDGSIFGQQCATSTISVAAIVVTEATGIGGRFADPEVSPVASFSSRGPCYINSGSGLEERLKPVTTAANGVETSTVGFEFFFGTSASAPVAAAIATIVRAACFPRVVTFSDMMEMLTDYTYTIDVTSDAGGEEETWGVEAGYGIISADQILGWIAANCQESCPGASTTSPSVPTPAKTLIVTTSQTSLTFVPSKLSKSTPPVAPTTTPPIVPPTSSPVSLPNAPPTSPPSMPAPPTSQPTTLPVTPPTTPPTTPPNTPSTMPPVAPLTAPPAASPTALPTSSPIVLRTTPPTALPITPPTIPPDVPSTMTPVASPTASTAVPLTALPTSAPIVPPTTPPIAPPIAPPTTASSTPPTMLPIMPPTQSPTAPPTSLPIGGLVDASERTLVTVTANAFNMNTLWFGCPPNGCVATNTRDGDLSTRWSCKKDLLGGTNCEITYMFEEPQDIVLMLIAFYKGDERTRVLNINLDGSPYTTIESSGKTEWFEVFELNTNHTETLALEALELHGNEWISITEVQFLVV